MAVLKFDPRMLDDRDGFVIITAAADQGMVDNHDRKPLVLSPELAKEWIDPATTAARAEELAHLAAAQLAT